MAPSLTVMTPTGGGGGVRGGARVSVARDIGVIAGPRAGAMCVGGDVRLLVLLRLRVRAIVVRRGRVTLRVVLHGRGSRNRIGGVDDWSGRWIVGSHGESWSSL